MSTAPKKAKLKNAIDDYFCFNPFNENKQRSADIPTLSKRIPYSVKTVANLWIMQATARNLERITGF